MTPEEIAPVNSEMKLEYHAVAYNPAGHERFDLSTLFADWIREQLGEKVRHHSRQLSFPEFDE